MTASKSRKADHWREAWRPAPGRPPTGLLGHREAQLKAQTLVLFREQEIEDSEQAQERRRRNAPVVFGTLMSRYLAEKESEFSDGLLKRSTILDLRSSLGKGGHVGQAFWFLKPEQVDNLAVERWLQNLRDEKGLSNRTQEKLRGQVGAVLSYGVEQGWIDSTPLVRTRRRRRKAIQAATWAKPDRAASMSRDTPDDVECSRPIA